MNFKILTSAPISITGEKGSPGPKGDKGNPGNVKPIVTVSSESHNWQLAEI